MLRLIWRFLEELQPIRMTVKNKFISKREKKPERPQQATKHCKNLKIKLQGKKINCIVANINLPSINTISFTAYGNCPSDSS